MGANILVDIRIPYVKVSIHAPVMGAKSLCNCIYNTYSFNPRTRDGCEYHVARNLWYWVFQSTHP